MSKTVEEILDSIQPQGEHFNEAYIPYGEIKKAAGAINQLIIEAKIEELQKFMGTLIYDGREIEDAWDVTSNDMALRIEELQQSLKEK